MNRRSFLAPAVWLPSPSSHAQSGPYAELTRGIPRTSTICSKRFGSDTDCRPLPQPAGPWHSARRGGAVGLRQVGKADQVTLNDRFMIGSCTKDMTVLMICCLVDTNQFDLEPDAG